MRMRCLLSGLLLLAACSADDAETGRSDTAVVRAADSSLRLVASVEGLSAPESAIFDRSQGVWLVSNISGSPGGRDNDGFISRITPDGVVDSLRFIAGGRDGVTLHAPKGMAIVGDTLWVADIDAIRGFSTATGEAFATIEFGARAGFLNDIVAGPDNSLYVTDTGIRFGEDGQASPTGTDQVFRVAPDRSVTTVLKSDSLRAPNGITWDAAADRFVIVSVRSPTLFHWTAGDSMPVPFGATGGGNDGVEMMGGRLLLTSWSDSSLIAYEDGETRYLVRGLSGPADIGIDAGRNRVAIPLLPADRLELYELPAR